MNKRTHVSRYAAGLLSLAFAGSAFAGISYNGCGGGGGTPNPSCATYSWDFSSNPAGSNPPGIAVNATGYNANTNTAGAYIQRPLSIYGTDLLALNYSPTGTTGLDPTNSGSGKEVAPFHAFDNTNGYDLVVLQFAKPVTLSQISMGYVDTDSDFSLFAFNPVTPGQTQAAGSPGAFSTSDILTKGWNLIGSFDYDALATGGGTLHAGGTLNLEAVTAGPATTGTAKNILNYASSYWAIGAVVNSIASAGPTYGADVSEGSVNGVSGNDRFKIASIAGCYTTPPGNKVPEPASLALVGLALAGAERQRRKRSNKA